MLLRDWVAVKIASRLLSFAMSSTVFHSNPSGIQEGGTGGKVPRRDKEVPASRDLRWADEREDQVCQLQQND